MAYRTKIVCKSVSRSLRGVVSIFLIKSDGGNGPMMSGNLHLQGAKSDG